MKTPWFQNKPILVDVLTDKFSIKFKGGSGFVTIIAPLPSSDYNEFPFTFVAVTLAYTLDPQVRLYGDDCNTATGMLQDIDDITVDELGLQ